MYMELSNIAEAREQNVVSAGGQSSKKDIWPARVVLVAEIYRHPNDRREGCSYQSYALIVWEVFGMGHDKDGRHRLAYGFYPLSMKPRSRIRRLFQRSLGNSATPTRFNIYNCLGQYGLVELAEDGEELRVRNVSPCPNGENQPHAALPVTFVWENFKFPQFVRRIMFAKGLMMGGVENLIEGTWASE